MNYYLVAENGNIKRVEASSREICETGQKITESEYNTILSEIHEKVTLVNQLYSGEITIDDVPPNWQEEIQRRVNERIAAEGTAEEQDIPADEALSIILGGETT